MAGGKVGAIEVQGIKELSAALAEFSKSTSRAIVTRALRAAAEPIAEAARAAVPVDEGVLKASIKTRVIRTNAGQGAYAAARRSGASAKEAGAAARAANRAAAGKGASARVRVAATAPHAHLVEFGSVHNKPPEPFMRQAFDTKAGPAMAEIGDAMRKEIEKAARRAAARALRKAR